MSEYRIPAVEFGGVDTVQYLADLANDISKVVPDIVFKPHDMNTWGIDKNHYPKGLCVSLHAYHTSDLNNHVGLIEVSSFYTATDKPRYGITSINIDSGRHTYGGDGKYKYSIHAKNIIREAKKALKPFTFEQIADRAKKKFKQEVESIGYNMGWEIRNNTCQDISTFKDDLIDLYYQGHDFKSAKVKRMTEYLIANQEKIAKYQNYDPDHYFVLVKDGEVQYRLNSAKDNPPTILPSKDALPDDIKGKLFVLDITDKQSFVEDVGLKENDGAYWIIA